MSTRPPTQRTNGAKSGAKAGAHVLRLRSGARVPVVSKTAQLPYPTIAKPAPRACHGLVTTGPQTGLYCERPVRAAKGTTKNAGAGDWCGDENRCADPSTTTKQCLNRTKGCRNQAIPTGDLCVLCAENHEDSAPTRPTGRNRTKSAGSEAKATEARYGTWGGLWHRVRTAEQHEWKVGTAVAAGGAALTYIAASSLSESVGAALAASAAVVLLTLLLALFAFLIMDSPRTSRVAKAGWDATGARAVDAAHTKAKVAAHVRRGGTAVRGKDVPLLTRRTPGKARLAPELELADTDLLGAARAQAAHRASPATPVRGRWVRTRAMADVYPEGTFAPRTWPQCRHCERKASVNVVTGLRGTVAAHACLEHAPVMAPTRRRRRTARKARSLVPPRPAKTNLAD